MERIDTEVAIAGGGLAGLTAAILLARQGYNVVLVEKNRYPFHRVCGEYVSEESRPFLKALGLDLPANIYPLVRKLQLSAPNGFSLTTDLLPGGFGISRYCLDAMLAELAREAGVTLLLSQKVESLQYENGQHFVVAGRRQITARLVLGCFGKRSNIDIKLNRPFVREKARRLSNYVAVKYHVRYNHPRDTIALHNFDQGYCGISAVENDRYCLCYLTLADNLAKSGNDIRRMETEILARNPFLQRLWSEADFSDRGPLSISQVSFAAKSKVEDHVLMLGDAAGLITPLCGNGMSMAFHSAKLASALADSFLQGRMSRDAMEQAYSRQWQRHFGRRLQAGRTIQSFFGNPRLTNWLLRAGSISPAFTRFLIGQTHGDPF